MQPKGKKFSQLNILSIGKVNDPDRLIGEEVNRVDIITSCRKYLALF